MLIYTCVCICICMNVLSMIMLSKWGKVEKLQIPNKYVCTYRVSLLAWSLACGGKHPHGTGATNNSSLFLELRGRVGADW